MRSHRVFGPTLEIEFVQYRGGLLVDVRGKTSNHLQYINDLKIERPDLLKLRDLIDEILKQDARVPT